MERVALGLDEVLRAQLLVAVLTAAEVEEVVGAGVDEPARLRVMVSLVPPSSGNTIRWRASFLRSGEYQWLSTVWPSAKVSTVTSWPSV